MELGVRRRLQIIRTTSRPQIRKTRRIHRYAVHRRPQRQSKKNKSLGCSLALIRLTRRSRIDILPNYYHVRGAISPHNQSFRSRKVADFMSKRLWNLVASAALCILLSCFVISLHAQSGNANLGGRITDSSGAIIIGAEVTVRNVATNVSVSTQTNSEGHF